MTTKRILSSKDQFGNSAALPAKKKQEKTVPFSLRLTRAEHARLKRQAAGMSMAAYARMRLLGNGETMRRTRGKFPVKDHQALSKLLGLIGTSEYAVSLKGIAHAVRVGILAVSPETEHALHAACQSIQDMKNMLMVALGIQER